MLVFIAASNINNKDNNNSPTAELANVPLVTTPTQKKKENRRRKYKKSGRG